MLIPRSNLLTNQVTSQRSKALTKTLRDIVLIMADFVGTNLAYPLLMCWLSQLWSVMSRVQDEEERKLFFMADKPWITWIETPLIT